MIRKRQPYLSMRAGCLTAASLLAASLAGPLLAEVVPVRGAADARIRTAPYDGNQVYRVRGFVGYQIDFEFEPGESFVGLAPGISRDSPTSARTIICS